MRRVGICQQFFWISSFSASQALRNIGAARGGASHARGNGFVLDNGQQESGKLGLAFGDCGFDSGRKINLVQNARLAVQHDLDDTGVSRGESVKRRDLDFNQRQRDRNEQLEALGMAMRGGGPEGRGFFGVGVGDGKEELDALGIAFAGGPKESSRAVGIGIRDGDELANALGVPSAGRIAKSGGVASFGVRDGNEKLHAFGVAIPCSPAKSLRLIGVGVGQWNQQLDAFGMAVAGGEKKSRGIIDHGAIQLSKKAGEDFLIAAGGGVDNFFVEVAGIGHGRVELRSRCRSQALRRWSDADARAAPAQASGNRLLFDDGQ